MSSQLIVALDFKQLNSALHLIDALDPKHCTLKIGSEMFTLFGPQFVTQLVQRNFNIFLDLKFHDIPNTVANACKAAADLGVWMMNVHASGGLDMMCAARKAVESYGGTRPLIIAVTVLTSFSEHQLLSTGISRSLAEHVKELAVLAKAAELDGVVSSAHEVKPIKDACGMDFICVTPGIRLEHSLNDDQVRIMTPKMAIQAGSDYLVVGRPITQARNPALVVDDILQQIKRL